MKVVEENGITVKVIADSISSITNKRITSFEMELPRYIWAECLTHRLFSRNAASSRAIPVHKKLKMVWKEPVIPIKWGKNKPGMQSSDEITGWRASVLRFTWKTASKIACISAWSLMKLGLHKQWAGRILEPFERYKVVLTATEFENWFWLRDHEDAQPEINELARSMSDAIFFSKPLKLNPGEWHLPYIHTQRNLRRQIEYLVDGYEVDLETAQKVSASCCAQVSYRVLNQDIEKATQIFDKLITSVPVHASPIEHVATPMEIPIVENMAGPTMAKVFSQEGVTNVDKMGRVWSGNFVGWIQYRQTLENHCKW